MILRIPILKAAGKANELGKRGHSKENRTDCPLVTLALCWIAAVFQNAVKYLRGMLANL